MNKGDIIINVIIIAVIVGIVSLLVYGILHFDDWDSKYENEKRAEYDRCLVVTDDNLDYCYNLIIRN